MIYILIMWIAISFILNLALLPVLCDVGAEDLTWIITLIVMLWTDEKFNILGKVIMTLSFVPMGICFNIITILFTLLGKLLTWRPNKKS